MFCLITQNEIMESEHGGVKTEQDKLVVFCYYSLDNKIAQTWFSITLADRFTIHDCLWTLYYKFCKNLTKLHRNKVTQLLALNTKHECPHHDADYN